MARDNKNYGAIGKAAITFDTAATRTSENTSVNDSENVNKNTSVNDSENVSENTSVNDSENVSENTSVNDSENVNKNTSVNDSENTSVNNSEIASGDLSALDISKLINRIPKKPKFEELHKKDTIWFRNEVLEALNSITKGSKGEKTRIVNEAIILYLKTHSQ